MSGHTYNGTGAFDSSPQTQQDERDMNVEIGLQLEPGWEIFYDFVVTKTEAYYQLRSGYLPNAKYPERVNAKNTTDGGNTLLHCGVPSCVSKPFTRHSDLECHSLIHQKPDTLSCDYMKCPRKLTPFTRRDHLRAHYRGYHSEDLKTQRTSGTIRFTPPISFGCLSFRWWRCSKCLERVKLDDDGYTCPNCKVACHPERVAWRQKVIESQQSSPEMNETANTGKVDSDVWNLLEGTGWK